MQIEWNIFKGLKSGLMSDIY